MRILNPAEITCISGALDGALYLVMANHLSTPEEIKRFKTEVFIMDASVLGSTLGASGALHYVPHFSASLGILSGGTVFGVLVGGAIGYAAAKWVISMEALE